MNKHLSSLLFLFILLSGCSPGKQKNNLEEIAQAAILEEPYSTISDSGVVYVSIENATGRTRIYKKQGQTIYLEFESPGKQSLVGSLFSGDSMANIRFSQIFLPDGSMDGPFGREIHYDLPFSGIYKIAINENMMAGDPWEGEFTAVIDLNDPQK